jgi:hypothetical protein
MCSPLGQDCPGLACWQFPVLYEKQIRAPSFLECPPVRAFGIRSKVPLDLPFWPDLPLPLPLSLPLPAYGDRSPFLVMKSDLRSKPYTALGRG